MNDLRIPIGTFFLIAGLILSLSPGDSAPLASGRVNLYSGLVMFVFGAFMLALAARARRLQ